MTELTEAPQQWKWALRWLAALSATTGMLLAILPAASGPTFDHLNPLPIWPEVAGVTLALASFVQLWAVMADHIAALFTASLAKALWYWLLAGALAYRWIDWFIADNRTDPPAVWLLAVFIELAGLEVLQATSAWRLLMRGISIP